MFTATWLHCKLFTPAFLRVVPWRLTHRWGFCFLPVFPNRSWVRRRYFSLEVLLQPNLPHAFLWHYMSEDLMCLRIFNSYRRVQICRYGSIYCLCGNFLLDLLSASAPIFHVPIIWAPFVQSLRDYSFYESTCGTLFVSSIALCLMLFTLLQQ